MRMSRDPFAAPGAAPAGASDAGGPRFPAIAFGDLRVATDIPFLVRGLLPRAGLAVVYGPPKSGKSFWTFDLVMHVALGWPYRGRKVAQGAVVYVSCEGHHGFPRRVEAFRQRKLDRHGHAAVPFWLVPSRLDLAGEHATLIGDIRTALGETRPAAVVIDTLNRSLVGSESKDEDMTAYIKAAEAVRDAFACLVLIVHHSGIDRSRPRGHTSLAGAADAQIAIRRDGGKTITATVEFMKDGEDGETVSFWLEPVDVGLDDDGDPLTSCVVQEDRRAAAIVTTAEPKLTPNQKTMLTILEEAGPGGLTADQWNDQARAVGLSAQRQRLYDLRIALKAKGLATENQGQWYAVERHGAA